MAQSFSSSPCMNEQDEPMYPFGALITLHLTRALPAQGRFHLAFGGRGEARDAAGGRLGLTPAQGEIHG
jgi:hypothetical protein